MLNRYKDKNLENTAINTLRVLSVSAINKAKSGHTGICLGAAAIMYELFVNHLNVSPKNYKHFNRDRFVLSAGHGAPLLYATMLLCQYKNIAMEDLKKLRQMYSKTSGHPEPMLLDNIEVATGPLGQGIAMSVGLAMAEKKYESLCNQKRKVINHYTYCLFGDGCLQEGAAMEAISLAGHYKLNKLIMLYDSNDIQLDGKTSQSSSLNTKEWFKSQGWNYILVKNGNSPKSIGNAISRAKKSFKPTVIEIKTTIGFGCELANSNKIHGTPLNDEQLKKLKVNLGYKYENFFIPNSLSSIAAHVLNRTEQKIVKDNGVLTLLEKEDIGNYNHVVKIIQKNTYNFDAKSWLGMNKNSKSDATRNVCNIVLQDIIKCNQNIILSCADLTSSTKVVFNDKKLILPNDFSNCNLALGVREFAMSCIVNGICSYQDLRAVGSTFLSFCDYCKPAIRIAAISHVPSTFVFSHDSITVGEDGPTHQPIEQIWMLRDIPNHYVFRPCNYSDMAVALDFAFTSKDCPTTIITSRGNFELLEATHEQAKNGAYVIYKPESSKHDLTIYATGSEVPLAVNVAKKLNSEIKIRVVAINSLELLNKQPKEYCSMIFDKKPKISIEYGSTLGWYKYVDYPIGVDSYGTSAPSKEAVKSLGLDQESIIKKIKDWYNTKK